MYVDRYEPHHFVSVTMLRAFAVFGPGCLPHDLSCKVSAGVQRLTCLTRQARLNISHLRDNSNAVLICMMCIV